MELADLLSRLVSSLVSNVSHARNFNPEPWALVAAALIAFFSWVSVTRSTLSARLSNRYYEIIQLAATRPEYFDVATTSHYAASWKGDALLSYEAVARLCWSHARDILDSHFLFIFSRRQFIREYANAFELYRNTHIRWLQDHRTFITKRAYHRFINRCRSP